MSNPSSVPDSDPIVRLERELSRVSDALKRTERSLGGFQWAFALLVIGGVAAVILMRNGVIDLKQVLNQPAIAAKVESKGFDFYNRFGKRVMFLEDDKFGLPRLVAFDDEVHPRLGITLSPGKDGGATEIVLIDGQAIRAQYRLGNGGEAMVRLFGNQKKGEILMQVTRDGRPSLTMTDASGKILFHAPENVSDPDVSVKSSNSRR
jgi:hypothetical protein